MTRTPATWKIVTFGTALTGLGIVGVGAATADDGGSSAQQPAAVSVAADDSPDATPDAPADAPDASPESADSPTESATDSPDVAGPDLETPDTDTAAD